MMKKRTIIGISAAAVILAAIAMGTLRPQNSKPRETAAPTMITQTQTSFEKQPDESILETVTLTEPEQSDITATEPLIESDPVQKSESKPTSTPTKSQGQPPHAPITPPEIPKKKPQPAPAQPQAPKNGDAKDGQIYIEGFGWVEDHGSGGSGTVDNQMYCNGNKIGYFGV